MIDANLTGIIIVGISCLALVCIVTITTISNTKLKVEKIRADALIRAEEVKAKNQLEIEKLLYSQPKDFKKDNVKGDYDFQSDDLRQVREKKDINN